MKSIIFTLAVVFTTFSFAQDDLVLKGKVVDKTGLGVPTASLRLLKNGTRSYTDLDGGFSLRVIQSAVNDTVVASSIGFNDLYIPVQKMTGTEPYIVILEEAYEELGEVMISFDKKETDPFRIVREVLKRRITNYPTEPQRYGMFYRAAFQENGEYVFYEEAVKEVYDRSFGLEFTKKADMLVGHHAVRMTADSSNYYIAGDQDRFAMVVMQSWDDIRSKILLLEDDVLGNWVFQLDSMWFKNDVDKYYTISGRLSKSAASAGSVELYKLPDEIIMTVAADKYALRKLECAYQIKRWLPNMRDTRGYSVKAMSSKSIQEFDWVDDRLYTSYSYFKDDYQVFQRKTDSVLANYSIEEESFFTGVMPPGSESSDILDFPYDHEYKFPYELYKLAGAYDSTMWGGAADYDSEFYQAVIADLGSPEELTAEFIEQGTRAVAYQTCYDKYRYEIIPLDEKEIILEKCIQKELVK
jgi:hypothetical protein